MWPDARFPLGAWFPGDSTGGLGCVTTGEGGGRGEDEMNTGGDGVIMRVKEERRSAGEGKKSQDV